MQINYISINRFRNLKQIKIEPFSHLNIFYGENGQGKTNILEAIFYTGTLKSFRNAKNSELITWDQQAADIKCLITDNRLEHELRISLEANRKLLSVDGKTPARIVDYCNIVSVVAFSPEELIMIDGTPEQRRRYLDRAIFSSNPDYLKIYHDYFRVLKQRNYLLRNQNYKSLDAWTDQLVLTATKLIMARKNYLDELACQFSVFYKTISASDEEGYLCYHPNSLADVNDHSDISRNLHLVLAKNLRIERERGTTINGPHRDDLGFYLNDRPICQHGSQGQKKSFIIAIKMAEIECLKKKKESSPILLLDDMTTELDKNRVKHLLEFINSREIQVFITTTDKTSIPVAESSSCSFFKIESGSLVK